jgi:hypothetical protein
MVEIGADPLPLEAPLLEKFVPSLQALANEVANQEAPVAAVQKVPDTPTALAIAPAKSPGLLRTLWSLFTATRRMNKAMKEAQRLEELRPKSDAEQMVNALYPSVMAMFGASPQLRAAHPEVAELAAAVDSHCLSALFSTLANEPFLILEPSTRRGMLATVSGVDINFSLNMLILHTFPDGEGKRKSRLTKRAATVLEGPDQCANEMVFGIWNLYNWQALRPDATLPEAQTDHKHWIWNEGTPSDIALFEGRRVVLLGPASYQRSWPAQRTFASMKPELNVERILSPEEVDQWIARICAVNSAA